MDRGDRVIVGGAEILHRAPITEAFVRMAGGRDSPIAVLASGTASPEKMFARQRSWLGEAGVPPDRVNLLRVSAHVEGWEAGAWSGREIVTLEEARGLWILGGDQNQILRLLRDPAGGDSPLLAALRRRAAVPGAEGGLVVGGTSAGAAVMSDPMIGAGTSFGALALPRATGPGSGELGAALLVRPGLGLFADGLLDQHFDARARLARLLEAAIVEDGARRPAFGIAEATALVRSGLTGRLSVIGAGGVYIVDPRPARRRLAGPDGRIRIEGARLHLLTDGDAFDPATETFDFGAKEELLPSDAAFAVEDPVASGALSPYGTLADFAARMLLDNDPSRLARDPATGEPFARSLLVEEAPGPAGLRTLGWELRLRRAMEGDGKSRLYYDGRYSFANVGLDLIPIDIEIRRPE